MSGAGVAVVVAVPVMCRQWLDPQNAATTVDVLRWLLVLAISQTAGSLIRWAAGAALVQTIGALLLIALPPCFGFEGVLLVMIALRLGFERATNDTAFIDDSVKRNGIPYSYVGVPRGQAIIRDLAEVSPAVVETLRTAMQAPN